MFVPSVVMRRDKGSMMVQALFNHLPFILSPPLPSLEYFDIMGLGDLVSGGGDCFALRPGVLNHLQLATDPWKQNSVIIPI